MDLKEIKTLTWNEVFSLWRNNEANVPHWIEHYKEAGYTSWDDWRKHGIKDLPLENLDWKLFDILDPKQTIPEFFGGPFRAWIKHHYGGKVSMKFSQLAQLKSVQESLTTNQIIENFPANLTLIGLRTEKGIVIIEGMHRCCAVAVALLQNRELVPSMYIALADFMDKEIPIMGKETSPTV